MAELVRFEEFELDVRRYALRRSGRPLKLERIPMELLLLLVDRRGELITREEIVDKLWGKDVFLDTDNSINTAIRKIRQILRDDPEQPRFVQTVPAKGYRFIAPVIEVEPPAVAVEASLSPATPASALPAGQVVAHYRILQKIGSGGMGVRIRGRRHPPGPSRRVEISFREGRSSKRSLVTIHARGARFIRTAPYQYLKD